MSGDCLASCDRSWRIIVAFGALPACFALYYRITIPETPRYTFDVAHDIEKGDADIKAYMESRPEGLVDPVVQARARRVISPSLNVPSASWPDVVSHFKVWKNTKVLLGTTLSWFFLVRAPTCTELTSCTVTYLLQDMAYYGLTLNNGAVLQAIGFASGTSLYEVLRRTAIGMIILVCAGGLPGYWAAVFTIDTVGRKPLQVIGFAILTLIFGVLGFYFHHLSKGAMFTLYIFAQASPPL